MIHLTAFFRKNYKTIIIILFFLAFLLIGLSIYKDYGISIDEDAVRARGDVAIDYILKNNTELLTYPTRTYGTFYDVLLVIIERAFKLSKDLQKVFFTRHLVNFLLFYLSVICFYFLCKKSFKSWKAGLLGSTFLILSPRIFADSFYNPKDIPFMSLFIISIFTLVLFLERKTVARAIIHALATAILIDIRILGIIVPFFTIIFFIADLLVFKGLGKKNIRIAGNFFIHIFFLAGFTILFWPYLWTNPIGHLVESFREMSNFPWKGYVLYMGHYINPAINTPWHYTLVWILVTTPILYICFFITGMSSFVKNFIKDPKKYYLEKKGNIIFVLWFFMPLLAVIILKSVLYNGWRQMFFIYPALILLSLEGVIFLFNYIKDKFRHKILMVINIILSVIIISSFINTSYFMIKNHPFQNLYFNVIAGKNMEEAKNNFDLDYWDLTYKKAIEYLAQNDSSSVIKFTTSSRALTNGGSDTDLSPLSMIGNHDDIILLPYKYKGKLLYVEDIDKATYFIANYINRRAEYPLKNEFYSISINGAKIVTIYKLK